MNKNAKYKKIINTKSQKGITLIVLVITIMVMLILAGATINMVLGEGGFLNQSEKAKKIQEEKIKKEDTEVDNLIEKADEERNKYTNEIKNGIIVQDGETVWDEETHTATIKLKTTEIVPAGTNILYQIDSTKGTWILYQESGIANLNHGSTVFARLYDGKNENKETGISIIDDIEPELANISGLATSVAQGANITATVEHRDKQSGINLSNCKWIMNNSESINAEDVAWNTANTFDTATNQISIIAPTEPENYYLHVLSVDMAGKKRVTNSIAITVLEVESDWAYLGRVAKSIATRTDITINNETQRVTGETELKEDYDINVGDTFTVRYNGEDYPGLRTVRVLGFKHDELADKTVYRNNAQDTRTWEKAGISFEFVDFLTDTTYKKMNTSYTNEGGWAATWMREYLNGYNSTTDSSKIGVQGGETVKLSNSSQIKKVNKEYIATFRKKVETLPQTEDYLWMLSCAEVWSDEYAEGMIGYAIQKEGNQYKYYKNVQVTKNKTYKYNNPNPALVKKAKSFEFAIFWWLRSPSSSNDHEYGGVSSDGRHKCEPVSGAMGVAPGFSI